MKVLIASCIRQKESIFREFLQSLVNLNTEGLEIRYAFIFHNWPEGERIAREYQFPSSVHFAHYQSANQYIASEKGHQWTAPLIEDMITMKNSLLNFAKDNFFDYVFLVDSDLYLPPLTLQVLLSRKRDIIAEVFWTRWEPQQAPMPNAWDYDHYSFFDGSLDLYRIPSCYRVGGTGACMLISRAAIEAGVTYSRFNNVSWWGEDRYFQLHAQARGFDLWLDTTCPVFHIYRESLLGELQLWKQNELPRLPYPDIRHKSRPRLTALMIVRNEANRYLNEVLQMLNEIADDIAIVDDHSNDNTADLCETSPKTRVLRLPLSLFAMEHILRELAWRWAMQTAPDWVLAIDADEIIEHPEGIRGLMLSPDVDIWAFRIFDMWDPRHYREDNYWNGHTRYTPMLLRVFPGFPYTWDQNKHHSFRLPSNLGRFVIGKSDIRIQHLGWMRPEDRLAKYHRYKEMDPEGTWGLKEQYESILDENPRLVEW